MLEALGIISLIFGGCCSNVYALEAILKHDHDSGLLITFMQFIFATLSAWPSQFDATRPGFVKKPQVPMHRWACGAAMFFAVNMLNNWAFAFNISVPVHIILRSFGSVITMIAGWLTGRKYSPIQWFSVTILTAGVLVSAWADALSKGKSMGTGGINVKDSSFELGLLVLLLAQILAAWMGVYVQDTYEKYGKHWAENLFYEHLLSLPLFLALAPSLRTQYNKLAISPPIQMPPVIASKLPALVSSSIEKTPRGIVFLIMNSLTQLLCLGGVNMLAASSSAVTVTVVLNIRKLVSFVLSCWIFGNTLTDLMIFGAALVFGAGALYGWETSVGLKRRSAAAQKTKSENGVVKEEKKQN